jgi:ureidoglycolate lyase
MTSNSRCIHLPLERATTESIAPYGALLTAGGSQARTSAFYGDKVELWSPGPFISDSDACVSVARVHPREREVVWLERHFKHTQAFIPLGSARFAVVLGAATETSLPDPATVRAFEFGPGVGLVMHIGTWHEFPFALDGVVDMAVLLRNETNRDLEVKENNEAVGGDLEKRNMQARLNTVFSF